MSKPEVTEIADKQTLLGSTTIGYSHPTSVQTAVETKGPIPDDDEGIADEKELTRNEWLGEGATAVVYAGKYRRIKVAIKYFKDSKNQSRRTKTPFQQQQAEYKRLAKANDPRVVRLFARSPPDHVGQPYLVLEHCTCSLQHFIHEIRVGPTSPEQIIELVEQIAGGAHIHFKFVFSRSL